MKELFDRFEEAKTRPAKLKIVRAALTELKVHAAIEEGLFYPAIRKPVGKEIMNEADEEQSHPPAYRRGPSGSGRAVRIAGRRSRTRARA